MRKILEKAFTIGLVMSLAKPQAKKREVTRINGTKTARDTSLGFGFMQIGR